MSNNVSNTVLYEVVGAIQDKWAPGIQGVSVGVASVIQVRPGYKEIKLLFTEFLIE